MSTGVLAELADLQARVAALEAQVTGSDESAQPNYLTIDPATGLIGAVFSGGLELVEAPQGSSFAPSSIAWQALGVTFERIIGTEYTLVGKTVHDLAVQVLADIDNYAVFSITATESGPSGGSACSVALADDVNIGTAVASALVLDSAGHSSFLQLPTQTKAVAIDYGSGVMPFNGTAGPVTVAVNHGIGRIPIAMLATYNWGSAGVLAIYSQNFDAHEVTWRGTATAAEANADFTWIVIG